MDRKTCEYPGCTRLGRNKGYSASGQRVWGLKCERHHKFRIDGKVSARATWIHNDACERCGWNDGPCDRHRINPGLPYNHPGNTQILCPNCHRLESIKQENERRISRTQHNKEAV